MMEDLRNLIRFETWAILKAVAFGAGKEGVRFVVKRTGLAPNTVEKVLGLLIRYRIVEEERKKRWPWTRALRLTERGQQLLNRFDSVGELVRQIEREANSLTATGGG